MRRSIAPILLAGLCAATAAMAQEPKAGQEKTTVQEELEIIAKPNRVKAPEVGPGAADYSNRQMQTITKQMQRSAACLINVSRPTGVMDNKQALDRLDIYAAANQQRKVAREAETVLAANKTADEVRRRAASGTATVNELVDSELARQAAVQRYNAVAYGAERVWDPKIDPNRTIHLEVKAIEITPDPDGDKIIVEGVLHNLKPRTTEVPTITITALDDQGRTVMNTAYRSANLRRGEARPFRVEVPAPPLAMTLKLAVGDRNAMATDLKGLRC